VRAQETRRILDRLVGYTVSPLLWRKIAPKLSAGRVQSVAVRLLVLRERERRDFRTGAYWDLTALLNKRPDQPNHRFEATLISVGGKRVASGRDFDEHTGKIAAGKDVLLLNQQEAVALRQRCCWDGHGAWPSWRKGEHARSLPTLHHQHAAAGSQPQAGAGRQRDDAHRAEPL
jgi:hypothetical protein